MKYVYLLYHTKKEDEYMDDSKFLGAYSSKEIAQEKIERHYKFQDGFKDYHEGFTIDKCEIDKMEWTEGFITIHHG